MWFFLMTRPIDLMYLIVIVFCWSLLCGFLKGCEYSSLRCMIFVIILFKELYFLIKKTILL